MTSRLALVAILVRDYDEAIAWYRDALGFVLAEDTHVSADKRWVTMRPPGGGTGLLLARAVGPQQARIGDQTGGRVGFFLSVDDFDAERRRMEAAGVVFEEATRHERYGPVAVFRDLYGTRWDLLGPSPSA